MRSSGHVGSGQHAHFACTDAGLPARMPDATEADHRHTLDGAIIHAQCDDTPHAALQGAQTVLGWLALNNRQQKP